MIYFDNNATTRISSLAVASMLPFFEDQYFNASASIALLTGVDQPRAKAAAAMTRLLNAESSDSFVFTSGATESNNWIFSSMGRRFKTGRILISDVEHASVAESAPDLARSGFKVETIPVDKAGVIDREVFRSKVTDDILLVSIMAANNETGAIQPIAALGQILRASCPSCLFHTDATQAVGKIPVDLAVDWADVDFLSFSGHKFHGPKGIGGLYFRPGFELAPLIVGGGQEGGLRSGTSNTPGLAGLAAAAVEALDLKMDQIAGLRDKFESELLRLFPTVQVHSKEVDRLPNTCYFSMPNIRGDEMVDSLALAGVIVGTGAACADGTTRFSQTLTAMGVSHDLMINAVRVSLSRLSTWKELEALLSGIEEIAKSKARQTLSIR